MAGRNWEAWLDQRAGEGTWERWWEGRGQGPILRSVALGNPDGPNPEQCDVIAASK